MKYTKPQLERARLISKDPEVIRARKILVLYKSPNPDYAMFRLNSANMYKDMVMRNASNRKLTLKIIKWMEMWSSERDRHSTIGQAVYDLYNAIERVNKPFKQ